MNSIQHPDREGMDREASGRESPIENLSRSNGGNVGIPGEIGGVKRKKMRHVMCEHQRGYAGIVSLPAAALVSNSSQMRTTSR